MDKFAMDGITMQIRSRSYDEAVRQMEHYCSRCQDGHGRLSCDNCPIMKTHRAVVKVFEKCGEAHMSAAELFDSAINVGVSFNFA